MAHTITAVKTKRLSRGGKIVIVDIDVTSVTDGGEVIDLTDPKIDILSADSVVVPGAVGAYTVDYEYATKKLRYYGLADGVEAVATTDVGAGRFTFIDLGRQ